MGHWTLDDIPWDRFDRGRVDPQIVPIVKAAAVVEYNGGAYAHHLCRIFADDPDFQKAARRWGGEEIQHGRALGRWAELVDPSFDFAAAFARFRQGYRVDFDSAASRRGSRAGEMIARCMVEVGTSSYYTALHEAVREPVLKAICRQIAADEIRHYKLFRRQLMRCLEGERLGLLAAAACRLRADRRNARRRTCLCLLRRERGRARLRPQALRRRLCAAGLRDLSPASRRPRHGARSSRRSGWIPAAASHVPQAGWPGSSCGGAQRGSPAARPDGFNGYRRRRSSGRSGPI